MAYLPYSRFSYSFIGLFIIANVIWNLAFQPYHYLIDWGGVTFQVIACLISILWLGFAFFKHTGEGKSFWLFLALGVLSYLVGTLIWSINEFVLQTDGVLRSIPSSFWVAQNGFYFIALLVVMYKIKNYLLTIRSLLDLFIVMSAAFTFSWIFLINPLVEQGEENILLSPELLYPVLDLGMLVGTLSFFAASSSIFSKQVRVLLITGLVIQIIADTIYTYLHVMNNYSVGSINEPLWLFSILLLGLSGVYHNPGEQEQFIVQQPKQTGSLLFKLSLPHLSVILLALYAVILLYEVNPIAIGLFFCVLLVLLRQVVTLLENEKLMQQLNGLNEELEEKVKERTDKLVEAVNSMEHLAFHDAITGLPNRRFMEKRLSQAISRPGKSHDKTAFLLLDLDRFKNINDSLGHSYGDQLLKEVGSRLVALAGKNEVVSRIGGDEYALLIENTTSEKAEEKARLILNSLRQTYRLNEFDLTVTPSIGISLFPDHGNSMDELLMKADSAMYQVKASGRNHYKVYNRSMKMKPIFHLESALKKGIEEDEFLLYFQPQISLQTGRIEGAEALLRWDRKDHGIISPAEFISLAEETGLILPIGEKVFREVCRQSVAWQQRGFTSLRLAVNISPLQFQQDHFIELISSILKETGADPRQIELEITESVAMGSGGKNRAKMSFLKKMGFQLALDDFGTGYSSLQYLSQFQIDRLKIDRSFIASLEKGEKDKTIVQLIVTMGKELNVKVLAEGVETKSQKAFLNKIGCDEMQGYLFSKPINAQDFEQLLLSEAG